MTSPRTLPELLRASASGHDVAVIVPEVDARVTYESLCAQVGGVADALASAGIRRGERVAITLPNGLPAIVSFLGASTVGTAAPLNPGYRYEEFCFYLEDTAARLLLCPREGADEARRAAAARGIPVLEVDADERGVVGIQGAPSGASASDPALDDVALILHTSGSTGRPKRVPIPHANLAVSAGNTARTYALSA